MFLRILAFLAVMFTSTAWAQDCPVTADVGQTIVPASNSYYPLCHKGYFSLVDARTKNPAFVQETVTAKNAKGKLERTDHFKSDPALPRNVGSKLSDYEGSGYARGHMAPADDFAADQQMMDESFYLSNMVPQVQKCNNAGVWSSIERIVRDWAVHYETIYVVSGPIYDKQHSYIGDDVEVPDFLFKVVYNPVLNKSVAFLLPNTELCKRKPNEFAVTQDDVERITGYKFFPNVSGIERGNKLWQ